MVFPNVFLVSLPCLRRFSTVYVATFYYAQAAQVCENNEMKKEKERKK